MVEILSTYVTDWCDNSSMFEIKRNIPRLHENIYDPIPINWHNNWYYCCNVLVPYLPEISAAVWHVVPDSVRHLLEEKELGENGELEQTIAVLVEVACL